MTPQRDAVRLNRLIAFNHLWAIAGLCEWTRWTFTETGWSWALLLASAGLLLRPGSVPALAVCAAAQVVFTALAANRPWNHGLFMALMNLGILASIARWWCGGRRRSSPRREPERLLETFAPALRLGLVVLYLMTFFHKLNADFVNPEVSCAGWLLGFLGRAYRVVPVEPWTILGAIWTTLAVELAVPLLLCGRRTAVAGLALGAGFHLFLSQFGGLHGFAAMLFAIYYLFLPRAFTDRLAARAAGWRAPGPMTLAAGLAATLVAWKALGAVAGLPHIYRGLVLWDAWLLVALAAAGGDLVRLSALPADVRLRPRWAPLWTVPIVVLLNGVAPYVGLKTETAWAMYSNLRTEMRPNHFLVPAAAKVFGYQDDLVEVVATSVPALRPYVGADVRLTFFELRRLCSAATEDFTLVYRRHGEDRTSTVASEPAACRPHPWLLGKLLRFRPVDAGAHARCRH